MWFSRVLGVKNQNVEEDIMRRGYPPHGGHPPFIS
jgi:hypothetical protein